MTRYILLHVAIALTLLAGGRSPSPLQKTELQHELRELTQRGLTYRFLKKEEARIHLGPHRADDSPHLSSLIEIKEEWSGFTRIKTLHEPDLAEIYAWADTQGIPILEINPALLDTSQWTGWYTYWTQVPLSNGFGFPLLVGDADENGRPEVYGIYRDFTSSDFESHIYEIDSNGVPVFRHAYVPRRGASRQFVDSDGNSLTEVVIPLGDTAFVYEQQSPSSLPIHPKFSHAMFEYPGTASRARVHMAHLDNDALMDFLYLGSEPDSTEPGGFRAGTYVAEYNSGVNNFERVWSIRLNRPGEVGFGGYSFGDYDGDGMVEFIDSELFGRVHITENVSDDCYAETWRDSLPFVNVYYQTSGDVDNDGKPEFFVGATMSNGNWTTVFEADSNDHYSAKFLFHLLSGGTGDEPTYLTTDVDGSGRLELVIFSGADLYVFKSDADNSYYLWYYKRENVKQSVQFYDFNRDGIKDFVISRAMVNSQGLRLFADIYLASGTVSVGGNSDTSFPDDIQLFQNFPNPFNPVTVIEYELPMTQHVSIAVYDALGRKVQTLVNGVMPAGRHAVEWEGTNMASGVYFYRLETTQQTVTRKMLLIR
jgi:hypothetical protein